MRFDHTPRRPRPRPTGADPARPGHLDPDTTVTLPPVIDPARPPRGPDGEGEVADESTGVLDMRLTPDPWRRRAADRLTLAGRRHARHWDDLAGTGRQPGPHALIFLHRDPAPTAADPHFGQVMIASRMFLHGDDVTDLQTVLTHLHRRAVEYCDAGITHPIGHLAGQAEPMTRSARYLGLGVSTLDPDRLHERGDWPWQGLAILDDGTRLILRGTHTVYPPDLQSTHTLDRTDDAISIFDAFDPARAWRWAPSDLADHQPALAAHLDALDALHQLLLTTEARPRRHRRTQPSRRAHA